jgi:uncharacterized protein (DUF952 family)
VPAEVWSHQEDSTEYLPEGFDREGFIHCTNGLQELIDVANRYYAGDMRPFRVLILKMDQIASPVRYDDPQEIYPHIYGPLNTSAVVGMLDARRDEQGTFVSFSGSNGSSSAKGSKS